MCCPWICIVRVFVALHVYNCEVLIATWYGKIWKMNFVCYRVWIFFHNQPLTSKVEGRVNKFLGCVTNSRGLRMESEGPFYVCKCICSSLFVDLVCNYFSLVTLLIRDLLWIESVNVSLGNWLEINYLFFLNDLTSIDVCGQPLHEYRVMSLLFLECYYRIYSSVIRPFMTKKTAQKISLDLYTSHTQRPDSSNPINKHSNCLKSVRKAEFIKPVWIVFEFRHFSAHSSSTKKFEIIKFGWLDTKLLELISIVSSDCRADIFSYSFAIVYSAELLIPSNEYCSLVTWQMSLSRAVLLVTRDPSILLGVPSVYLISFQTQH